MSDIKSTLAQGRKLMNRAVGSGFIIWRSSDHTTTEAEIFIKEGVVHSAHTGQPLSFEFGRTGLIKAQP